MAYNTKFYAADYPTILTNGGVYKYLLFDNCEFYTKTIYASFQMQGSGSINRTALENYTFKSCLFHTESGFPVLEPASYNVSDAGTTLLVNCVYNAISATNGTPISGKVTEHNSFSFPNYTDFNNLQ